MEIRPIRLLERRTHEYTHGRVELHFWLCEPQCQQDVASDHHGFRWIPREDLNAFDFPEANCEIVRQLTGLGEIPSKDRSRSLDGGTPGG